MMGMRLVGLMLLSSVFFGNGDAQDPCGNTDVTLEDFTVLSYITEVSTGFENGLTCSWTVRAVNNMSTFAYQLTDIDLGVDDVLNVYAGTSTSDQNVKVNQTGTGLSLNVDSVNTPNIHVTLRTGTAAQTVPQSVDAFYMAGSDKSGASAGSCVNQTLTATADPQVLTSPAFPANYPVSSQCSWTITAPESATLELTFLMIDIEAGDQSNICNYDGLVVYLPGQKDTPELLICKRNVWTPETHEIANNQVQLDFAGDDSDSFGGFVLTYKAVIPTTTTTTTTTTAAPTTESTTEAPPTTDSPDCNSGHPESESESGGGD